MEWTEAEAGTYEEAVAALLNALGADRSEVELNHLGVHRKFLGFGKTVVRVRGRLKREAFEGAPGAKPTQKPKERTREKPAAKEHQREKHKTRVKAAEKHGQKARPRTPVKITPEMVEAAQKASGYLEEVLAKMGVENAAVAVVKNDDGVTLNIKSASGGLIIGRKGDTLEALQVIVEIYANRIKGTRVNLIVDTENYRARRQDKLMGIARQSAKKAVERSGKIYLGPMKSFERKLIHSCLQNNPRVKTVSEGEGEKRQVVVIPQKQ